MQSNTTPVRKSYSVEMEWGVLGSILSNADFMHLAIEHCLSEDDFFVESNRRIWQAMYFLHTENVPIDALSIVQELRHMSVTELRSPDGTGNTVTYAIAKIAAYSPYSTRQNFVHYCREIRDLTIKRFLSDFYSESLTELGSDKQNATEALKSAENAVFEIAALRQNDKTRSIRQIAASASVIVENRFNGVFNGVKTGLRGLDKLTEGGLENGTLVVIGARPAMGKSLLAGTVARNVAQAAQSVIVFSYEMSAEQYLMRIAASISGENPKFLTREGLQRFQNALLAIAQTPLVVVDAAGMTPIEIHAQAAQVKKRFGLALVVVDYLQIIRPNIRNARKDIEIGEISHALKNTAMKLDVPLVVLSSLNRGLESRVEKRPTMADLKESGDIESDADMVLSLYRPEYYNGLVTQAVPDTPHLSEVPAKNMLEIQALKNRTGALNYVLMQCDFERSNILDFEPRPHQQQSPYETTDSPDISPF